MLGAIMYFLIWFPLQFCKRFWWRWSVEGSENLPPRGQGMVLVVNHLHWLDVLIFGASLPLSHRPSWIAKVEIFANPVFTWWFREMMVIPIKRGRRDMTALTAAEEALKQGAALAIFPEGHRSDTGGLLEGHGGAVRLAARTGCPIVPIAIWGTEAGLWGVVRRKPLHMCIGEPFFVSVKGSKIPWELMNELTEEMMLRIAALMPEQYWGFYRERMPQAAIQPGETGQQVSAVTR